MIYTYDVPLDVFQVLRKDNQGNTVQTALGYSLITNRTGEGGIHFPPELQLPLKAGDEVIYNVVVPPGVTKAGFYSQFNNKTVQFRIDDGPKESYEPAIYPVGYRIGVDSSDTPVNLLPRKHQVRIIWDKQEPELLMGLSFTWQIKLENSSIYDSWVLSGKPMQPSVPQKSDQDRIIENLFATGFVDALKRMTGIEDLDKLQAKAVETGVWQALEKLDKL